MLAKRSVLPKLFPFGNNGCMKAFIRMAIELLMLMAAVGSVIALAIIFGLR